MTTILAAEGVSGIANDLGALFEFDALLFDGTAFALNRTGMLYLLSVVIIGVLVWRTLGSATVVPSRSQLAVENILLFVRNNIGTDVIGPQGRRYGPLLATIFMFTWVNALFGITPFINFPSTARMAVPAMMAMVSWIVYVLAGVEANGPKYFIQQIKPAGVPLALLPLLMPIELVSNFLVRPLTLAVRLFANTMAGHIFLAIIFVSANTFLVNFSTDGVAFAPEGALGFILGAFLAFVAGPAMTFFEIAVATIQAYIFTVLTAVYIQTSISHH